MLTKQIRKTKSEPKELKNNNSNNDQKVNFNKNNMIVAVRIRPLNPKEEEFSTIETLNVINKQIISVINGSTIPEEAYKNKLRHKQYAFDFAFDKQTDNEMVYQCTTKVLLNSVIEGYNATVFCYGATGSGKTFTMVGYGENPGIMVRSISDLFKLFEKNSQKNFNISLSYIEIYNETLRDLLSENSNDLVDLREDPKNGVMLVGVNEIGVSNATDVFRLLITSVNQNSSRSHAVLQIIVESRDKKNELRVIQGKFVLVDLAGSERLSQTKNTGMRLIESGNINKSLLALANVINSLVEANEKNIKIFIPWRDSKLTRLLKDSLSGNSRIVMIANVSPGLLCIEETLNTLKYANRAKNIKVNVKQNIIETDIKIQKYEEIIETLNQEITELKNLMAVNSKMNPNELPPIDHKEDNLEKVNYHQKEITKHFQEEIQIKKEIFQRERKIEQMKVQMNEKELQMYKNGAKNNEILKFLEESQKNIFNEQESLNNFYAKYNQKSKNRQNLQKIILEYKKELPAKILNYTYQYYVMIIENMNAEHRKFLTQNDMGIKDIYIGKLTDQIKLRDMLLGEADVEFKKRQVNYKWKDARYLALDDIYLQPYRLPMIVQQGNPILVQKKMNLTDSNKLENNKENILPQIGVKSNGNANGVGNVYKHKRSKSPVRSFNYELGTSQRVQKPVSSSKGGYLDRFIKHNRVLIKSQSPSASALRRTYQKEDAVNTSAVLDKSTSTIISKTEKEFDKKVKTIIGRNIIKRYRNSPYVK